MVQDDEPVGLDGLRVEFDDERVVSDAGVMLVSTLAQRLTDAAERHRPPVPPLCQPERWFRA